MIDTKDLALVDEINKIKYWRKIRAIKLTIAVVLVIGILWFCWINYSYANDVREYHRDYGNMWSCYLCGYENLRSCSCINNYNGMLKVNEDFKTNIGVANTKSCNIEENYNYDFEEKW